MTTVTIDTATLKSVSSQPPKVAALEYAGSDCIIAPEQLTPELVAALIDCGGSGDAEPAVTYVLQNFTVTGDPEQCRGYLRGYGSWDEDELVDHEANLMRLVWLTGGQLADGEDVAYFAAY